MSDPDAMVQGLWLIMLVLLICLGGAAMLVLLRVLLRRRRFSHDRQRNQRADGQIVDPWKASAQRLIVPTPRPNEPEGEPDANGPDK